MVAGIPDSSHVQSREEQDRHYPGPTGGIVIGRGKISLKTLSEIYPVRIVGYRGITGNTGITVIISCVEEEV